MVARVLKDLVHSCTSADAPMVLNTVAVLRSLGSKWPPETAIVIRGESAELVRLGPMRAKALVRELKGTAATMRVIRLSFLAEELALLSA